MKTITSVEFVRVSDPITKEGSLYMKFTSEAYPDGEKFIKITQDEFEAILVNVMELIAKKVNEKKPNDKK